MDENWRDTIKIAELTDHDEWRRTFNASQREWADFEVLEGATYFLRRKNRKFRKRYIVIQTDDVRRKRVTNAEIRYRKSKKAWTIYIDKKPVRSYRTLIAAKMALMPCPLDRMAAEVDATCPDMSDSEKSSTDVP
jgi:hypothetical protein